jgi:hypothetical protein
MVELVQLLSTRDAPQRDGGALLRGRREGHATSVQCKCRDRCLVHTDDLRDGERLGREEQHVA